MPQIMESKDRSCVSGSEIVANASATAENIIEPFAERLAKEILDDCFEALFPPASSLVAHLLHTNHCGSSDSLHSTSVNQQQTSGKKTPTSNHNQQSQSSNTSGKKRKKNNRKRANSATTPPASSQPLIHSTVETPKATPKLADKPTDKFDAKPEVKAATVATTKAVNQPNGPAVKEEVKRPIISNNTANPKADQKTAVSSQPVLSHQNSLSSVTSSTSDSEEMQELKVKQNGTSKPFSPASNGISSLCKICSKHVYHMEQIKAVKAVFHKSCFRCKECNKQLNVDSYSSHEGIIYCKPHFKQLFQPKAVFDEEIQSKPTKPKYELIICENTPEELPSDVVRCNTKQDVFENLNLDLSNIRNRFENGGSGGGDSVQQKKSSPVATITRSESVHKIMQKYQNRVAGEKDLCSSSDEEEEGAAATTTTDTQAEERIAFSGMSALKSQWETGTISNHRSDSRSVEDELTELRNKSKSSEPLKQLYERAIQEARSSENLSRPADTFVVDSAVRAGSIKEKFEKLSTGDESEEDRSERLKREREEEINRITESETCTKEARNRFKQIEANMGKDQVPNGSTDHAKEEADIPKVDTTKKMLNKFKALEAGQVNGGELNGMMPKSPKRITPPRETPKAYESEPIVDRDPNIVKSSYKTEDDIQVEPEKAKNLRAKFENWQSEIERENRKNEEEEEFVPNIDTTKNLRAMFESIKEEETKPMERPRPRINRFVESKAQGEQCYVCTLRLYPMEKMEFSGIKIHKNCFRCNKCHTPLRLDNYTVRAEKLFCIPHFKQMFMEKGNYDEGFGLEQHKDKWTHKTNGKSNGQTNGNRADESNGNGVAEEDSHQPISQF